MKKRRRRLSSFRRQGTLGEFTLRPKRPSRRRRAVQRSLSRALVPALVAVMILSLVMIAGICLRSVRTKKLNEELAALHAGQTTPSPAAEEETLPAFTAGPTATPEPVITAVPNPSPAAEEDAAARFHQVGGTPLAHMETLYNQNHDLIGWLNIPEVIDLPVMYRDNSYYLTHDFNRSKSAAGTIFLDENHRFTEKTQNLLLHGHNMKDGTMFGRLVHYIQDIDYYRSHPFVHFDTLWEAEEYVIFAVMRVPLDVHDERFINYFSHPTFASDASFDAYVRQLQLNSVYAVPIDVKSTDALLTLSTCIDEDRLVIVCRRIREGEARSRLSELVRLTQRQ
ncbi:MAG: sortase domain-bontaining protein [Candidatus Ventricola sp.]